MILIILSYGEYIFFSELNLKKKTKKTFNPNLTVEKLSKYPFGIAFLALKRLATV